MTPDHACRSPRHRSIQLEAPLILTGPGPYSTIRGNRPVSTVATPLPIFPVMLHKCSGRLNLESA